MRNSNSFSLLVFVVILDIGVAVAFAMHSISNNVQGIWIIGGAIVLAFIFSSAVQFADQWSRAVVLRLGKFRSLEGPGLAKAAESYMSAFVRIHTDHIASTAYMTLELEHRNTPQSPGSKQPSPASSEIPSRLCA
jgi:hypothetical protein